MTERGNPNEQPLGSISAQGLLDGLGLGSLPVVGGAADQVLSPVFNIVDGITGTVLGVLKGILPAELLELLKGALRPVQGVPIVGGLLDGLLGSLNVNGTASNLTAAVTGIPKQALNVAQLDALSKVLHTMTLVLGSPTNAAGQLLPAATGLARQIAPAPVLAAIQGVTGNAASPLSIVQGITGNAASPLDLAQKVAGGSSPLNAAQGIIGNGSPLSLAQGLLSNAPSPVNIAQGVAGAPISSIQNVAKVIPAMNALTGIIPAPGMVTAAAMPTTDALSSVTGAINPNAPAASQPANIIAAAQAVAGSIPVSQLVGDKLIPVAAGPPTAVATSVLSQVTDAAKGVAEAAPVHPTNVVHAAASHGPAGIAHSVLGAAPIPLPTDKVKDVVAAAGEAAPAPVKNAKSALPTDAVAGVAQPVMGALHSLTGGAAPLPNLFGGST